MLSQSQRYPHQTIKGLSTGEYRQYPFHCELNQDATLGPHMTGSAKVRMWYCHRIVKVEVSISCRLSPQLAHTCFQCKIKTLVSALDGPARTCYVFAIFGVLDKVDGLETTTQASRCVARLAVRPTSRASILGNVPLTRISPSVRNRHQHPRRRLRSQHHWCHGQFHFIRSYISHRVVPVRSRERGVR